MELIQPLPGPVASVPIVGMNPLNYISERWFWVALYALLLAWVVYLYATDPGPRPTERIENPEPLPTAQQR